MLVRVRQAGGQAGRRTGNTQPGTNKQDSNEITNHKNKAELRQLGDSWKSWGEITCWFL